MSEVTPPVLPPAPARTAAPDSAPVLSPSPGPGGRTLRVGVDGRPLQGGFREDSGRGVGVYARELMRSLAARRDIALTLWFERALPAVPQGFVPPGVAVRHYFSLPLGDRIASQTSVRAAAASHWHEVFHWLAHVHAPAFPPAHSVVTVHDLGLATPAEPGARSRGFGLRVAGMLEGRAIRHASVLLADSEATRQELLATHDRDPSEVFVAPLGVSPRFTPASAPEVAAVRKFHDLGPPFVLYLGGIGARKDVPLLLEAFARVRASRPEPLLLVLAGHVLRAPEYPALMQRAQALGITEVMRVLEFVPLAQLPMLLSTARVFAFPSRSEGFGLPPLEAMACGTPVVSTNGGALGEVLGSAALSVPPGDVTAFADALARVLDDEPLREELRRLGAARAAAFTWTQTAEATVRAYRAAAGTRRNAPG